ncbi:Thioredoxin H2 [Sesamum angolense]|uniref:Thioredoxin H2 n=1 Tax=Sesamum angolense TaxID=2727404 RepID=A0AAE2BYY1_9LAMI|nr:Thioredoxin H2 [Sesamum angolense]
MGANFSSAYDDKWLPTHTNEPAPVKKIDEQLGAGLASTFSLQSMSLLEKYTDVEFIKLDVDELHDIAEEFGVQAMPTFILIKKGKEVDKVVGAKKDDLQKKIEKHSASDEHVSGTNDSSLYSFVFQFSSLSSLIDKFWPKDHRQRWCPRVKGESQRNQHYSIFLPKTLLKSDFWSAVRLEGNLISNLILKFPFLPGSFDIGIPSFSITISLPGLMMSDIVRGISLPSKVVMLRVLPVRASSREIF